MNGCQIITPKQGNPSNSLDFNEEYSLYRFTENAGIINRNRNNSARYEITAFLNDQALFKCKSRDHVRQNTQTSLEI